MSDDERVDVEPAGVLLGTLAELRDVQPDAWTEGPLFDLALRLDRVTALREHLGEVQSWLEIVLAESMTEDKVPVPGVGRLKRTEEHRSTWRYPGAGDQMRDDLAAAVAQEVALDVATGDVDPMKRNVALRAIRTAYEAIPSFSSLNVAGRKRLHLKLDDYRSYSTHYKVVLEVGE